MRRNSILVMVLLRGRFKLQFRAFARCALQELNFLSLSFTIGCSQVLFSCSLNISDKRQLLYH
jgi:hypothetical protein